MLTEIEEKDDTISYKENKDSINLSGCKLGTEDEKTELTTYYELQTNTTVTKSLTTNYLHIYRTELMPKHLLILLGRVLVSGIYVDGIRASLYEAIEIPTKSKSREFYANNIHFIA
jgi:hypothetical protein